MTQNQAPLQAGQRVRILPFEQYQGRTVVIGVYRRGMIYFESLRKYEGRIGEVEGVAPGGAPPHHLAYHVRLDNGPRVWLNQHAIEVLS